MTPVGRVPGRLAPARCASVVADYVQKKHAARFFKKEKKMKISARNQLKGKIAEVTKGATTSHVLIEIGSGVVITASITNEAVADLQRRRATMPGRSSKLPMS